MAVSCLGHAAQVQSAGNAGAANPGDPHVRQVAFNMPSDGPAITSAVQSDAAEPGPTAPAAAKAPDSATTKQLAGLAAGLLLFVFVSRRRRDQI
jgi:hypothetical protein